MSCVLTIPSVVKKFCKLYIKLWAGVVWSNGRMIVWSGFVGTRVTGSGVVRSCGPIGRTYPMPLNPLRLKVTYGNKQDIPYFNKTAVYSYEKLNSNIP